MTISGSLRRGSPRFVRSLLLLLPFLAACATTGKQARGVSDPNADWLVGAWVIDGESCASDAGVHYRADGSWEAEDVAGHWQLRDNRLVLTVTRRQAPDTERAPSRISERIERQGADRFIARREDGSAQSFRRCRG
jgi:hypothetical protein